MKSFQSENINELVTALSKAQGEIIPALKDNINPHFKSKYADLSSIWNACRAPLSKQGLAVIQTMAEDNGKLFLVTTLAHASGQWMRSELPILNEKATAQGLGSAITYMRRYSLAAIVGVAPDEDDDGNAASKPSENKTGKVAQISQTISKQEAVELGKIIEDCHSDYQKQLWVTLNNSKITSLEQVTLDIFPRLKAAAIRKRDEALAMKDEITEVEELEA